MTVRANPNSAVTSFTSLPTLSNTNHFRDPDDSAMKSPQTLTSAPTKLKPTSFPTTLQAVTTPVPAVSGMMTRSRRAEQRDGGTDPEVSSMAYPLSGPPCALLATNCGFSQICSQSTNLDLLTLLLLPWTRCVPHKPAAEKSPFFNTFNI